MNETRCYTWRFWVKHDTITQHTIEHKGQSYVTPLHSIEADPDPRRKQPEHFPKKDGPELAFVGALATALFLVPCAT